MATTDAFGNPTQAMAIRDEWGSSRGIYAPTALGRFYSLAADLRVDRYATDSQFTTSDWAMQLTFAHNTGFTYDGTPQAGTYATALTNGWRLFLIGEGGQTADLDLSLAADVGIWYRVSLEADAMTGMFHTQIFDVALGTQLLDDTQTLAGWTLDEAQWDSIAFFGGDWSGTTPSQAVVDNIGISSSGSIPEPATALLAAVAGLGLLRSRRRWLNSNV